MTLMMTDAQRSMLRTHGTLVGRILIGLLFLVSGFNMLTSASGVAGVASMIDGLGIPLAALVAWVVVLVKVLGGAALILGYRVGCAAGALFVFTLLTIVFVHNTSTELINALKNLSIMGGLLYVMAFGPGDGWKLGK